MDRSDGILFGLAISMQPDEDGVGVGGFMLFRQHDFGDPGLRAGLLYMGGHTVGIGSVVFHAGEALHPGEEGMMRRLAAIT
jgi:hypothetical protein